MTLTFTKMNGAGNDFVVLDNRALELALTREQIARLCDRNRGVGADGLLAVEPAEDGADFKFRYYNADGGEAEMCGNGARCYARFAASLLEEPKEELSFETIAGTLQARLVGEEVCIWMSPPFDLQMDAPVALPGLPSPVHHLNTGVPHAVVFVEDVAGTDILTHGAALRFHEHFQPNGANANFAEILSPDHLSVRTYERGVENETLACGTGITACALIHHLLTGQESPVKITVRGGDVLSIGFTPDEAQQFSQVTLTGPADFVFTGQITL